MQNPPKMLLVTSNYPPEVGGPAKFTSEFAFWLKGLGIESVVVTTTAHKILSPSNQIKVVSINRDQNIVIRFIKTALIMAKQGRGKNSLVNGLFYESFLANLFFGFKYTAKVPSDIVWDRARTNQDTTLSVDEYQGQERGAYRYQRWFFKQSLKAAEKVIVPSGHLSTLVSRWGVPQEKISLIRNSQLIPEYKPNFEKSFDAISVGRLIPLKGNAELISVCAKSGYSLRVLGEGPQEEELRTLASKVGGKIEFLGSLTNSEVLNQIRGSRVFVLNSAHEGSPNALIEAMAQGAVCVVRSNPGTNELVRDLKSGIVVSNERSLDEALRMAIQDKELRKELSEEAYKFAKSELNQELNFKRILHACV